MGRKDNIEEMTESYIQFNEQKIIAVAVVTIFVHKKKNESKKNHNNATADVDDVKNLCRSLARSLFANEMKPRIRTNNAEWDD